MRYTVYQRKQHQENRAIKHAATPRHFIKDGYTSLLNKGLIFLIANPRSIIIIGEIPLCPYFRTLHMDLSFEYSSLYATTSHIGTTLVLLSTCCVLVSVSRLPLLEQRGHTGLWERTVLSNEIDGLHLFLLRRRLPLFSQA